MSVHYKTVALTLLLLLLAACNRAEPTAPSPTLTPQIVYGTATPRIVEVTVAPKPTDLPPAQLSESAGDSISFIDSGQRLGEANSWDVALGDLDGDGDLDAFVANSAQSEAESAVWINDGQGSFTHNGQALGYGQGVALGDLDGDSDLDAVTTHWSRDEQGAVWLNDGSGVFIDSGQNLGFAFRPALGDLDDDGDLDIFLAQMAANTVWLNDGRGVFSDTGQRLGVAITAAVALDDLDGDGDLDALAGGWEEAAKVWLNDGAGTFVEHEQTLSPASIHIHDLALGDMDGDGDLDAFTAVASGDPNQVWFNDGSGVFTDSGQPLHSSLAHGVSLGDLDGDGDLDALTVHGNFQSGSSGGRIWLNDSAGQFNQSDANLGDLYSVNVALGDLDGDGDPDIIIAHGETWQENGGELPNEVWLNETVASVVSAPSALVSTVTFNTSDNVKLAGTLFGEGDTAVILAHQGTDGADQTAWHAFGDLLAERGFTALAFDFRGIGQSEGTEDRDKLDIDLAAALQFLRDQGYERIICVGASMGGTACIRKAFDGEFAGLVALGSAMITGWGTGIEVSEDELTQLTLPKIFITAEDDNHLVVDHTTRMYERSPEPKALYLLPGSEHGTELFATDVGDELTTILLDFLEGVPDMPIASSSTFDLEERVDNLIVFYSERDGNAEIYTMNPDGGGQRRLTFNQFEDVAPVWSPDGSQIAFLSNRDDPNPQGCFPECFYQIYLINADGSDELTLVETEFSTHHPDWHPDGTKLSFDTEFGLQGDVYTVNADGSGLQLLITDGFWADWSPDGSQIAFVSQRDGATNIYIANADGSAPQPITNDAEMDVFPAWSPDGEWIAFAVIGPNFQNQGIFLINPDGSERVQLTYERRQVDEDPAWSPDGSQLVFQSDRDGNFEIYVMNADGTNQQRLTTSPAGDYWPACKP